MSLATELYERLLALYYKAKNNTAFAVLLEPSVFFGVFDKWAAKTVKSSGLV